MNSIRNAILLVICLGLTACASSGPAAPAAPRADYDLIIENGRVIDGTGAAWFYGDLAIRGDRIVRLVPRGLLRGIAARERIDAAGLVVAPGFFDIQSHSRGNFLGRGDGRVVSKVTMGVTTEIMGEGSTNAIINARTEGATTDSALAAVASDPFAGERGFDNWLRAMEQHGASVNFGSFLGGDNVRTYAMGYAQGAPNAEQLDSMRKVVRWAMEGGAFGIATALIYPPANFATTTELVEAATAMAPYGGLYITHMRSEADQYLEAIDEAIAIGKGSGVPVEIYHLKAGGRRNWHKAALAIAKIDSARAAGIDIQANMYPYVAGGTGLSACFPPWASADNKLFDNLASPEVRARMRAEILSERTEWENLCALATPEGVLVLGVGENNQQYRGKRLAEIATAMNKDWIDAAMDLVLSERQRVGTIFFMMDEANVRLQLQQPWIKFGTDAGGVDPDSARGLTHPRAYGTYTRILGKYVRDEQVIPLEDAIRKMTSAVATRLSIQDRGVLREGMFADITIFDANTIADRATFEEPHQISAGVRHVVVNGVPVIRDGGHTNAKPGRALRGPGYRAAPAAAPVTTDGGIGR
ncbi:MAG TPA: D-aminoacylase [Longimicrobiales bacterium]|nr:D-aminoacylase [Longimicrobiales bacterium]